MLWEYRRPVARAALAAGLVAAAGSLLIKNQFSSTARFTLVSDEFDATQLLGGLAAIAGRVSPGLRAGGGGTPDFGKAVATMESTLELVLRSHPSWTDSSVLVHLDLGVKDSLRLMERARKELSDRVSITADVNTGVVSLTYWDHDRYWSAATADAFVAATDSVLRLSRQSRAAALERFLTEQLRTASDTVDAAEERLLAFNIRNRLIQQSPALTLQAARLQREIDAAQSLFSSLQQQAATARLREVQNTPTLSLLDPSRPPYKKSWPPRTILTLLAMTLASALRLSWLMRRDLVNLLTN